MLATDTYLTRPKSAFWVPFMYKSPLIICQEPTARRGFWAYMPELRDVIFHGWVGGVSS